MRIVRVNEAETSFSALLAAVEAGEEITITRYGRIVVRMLPGARGSAGIPPHQHWGESRMALEAPSAMATGLLAPLD